MSVDNRLAMDCLSPMPSTWPREGLPAEDKAERPANALEFEPAPKDQRNECSQLSTLTIWRQLLEH